MKAMGKQRGDAPESKRMTYGGGRISAHKRESLKPGQFAIRGRTMKRFDLEPKGEESGRYPIHDLAHARNALARAAQSGNPVLSEKVRRAVYAKYPELKKRKQAREGKLGKALDLLEKMLEKAQYPTSAIVAQAGRQPYGTAGKAPGKETKEAMAGAGLGKETGKVMGEMKEMKEAKQGKETTAALREIGVGGKSATKGMGKAALGSFEIGTEGGPPRRSTGETLSEVYTQEARKRGEKETKEKGKGSMGAVAKSGPALYLDIETKHERTAKALTAAFMPRLSRAHEAALRMQRSATDVMTRGNSRFAKDIHTGPLTGEMIEDLEEDAAMRTHHPVPIYKSCPTCGRTYMAKSQDAECPTCSVNKSYLCSCGMAMIKSSGGYLRCPICNP